MPVRTITRSTIVPLSRPLREWKHLFLAISEVIRTFSFHSKLFRIDLILLKFKTKENKFLILY